MFHLTQYVVVRRDIALERIPVYAAHAAGIASFAWAAKLASEGPHPQAKWETLDPNWGFPSRIIRGAKTEARLTKLAGELTAAGVPFYKVVEPDPGPHQGQLMSVALLPAEKTAVEHFLKDFQNLRYKDVPDFIARGGRPE